MIKAMEFQLSYACNQSCVFCSESRSLAAFGGFPVTAREIARVLAVKRREGVERVSFAGAGEPTLHPHFVGALKAAKELGFKTSVVSNGWGLADAALAEPALPMIDELVLSLHGDTAALHERSTRAAGGFERLLRAFAHARARPGTFLATNTVVTNLNRGRAEAIVSFALGLGGVRRCQLSQLVPDGKGAERYAKLAVPHSWWRRAIPGLALLTEKAGAELWLDGLPICAAGAHRDRLKDLHLEPVVSVDRALVDGEPVLAETVNLKPGAQKDRLKPPVCDPCSERERCDGVFSSYVDAFGAGDLQALTAAPPPGVGGEVATLQDGWRNFFCDQDFDDARLPLDWDLARTLIVEYADRECFYSEPERTHSKWSFLDYPFEQPLRHGLGMGAGRSLATEIGEREIVMGTAPTMNALVNAVKDRAKGAEFALVHGLCTPLVMGDDLGGLARRCADACGGGAVEVSMNDQAQMNGLAACMRSILQGAGYFDSPGAPEAVNLFHFPRRFRTEAVLPMLGDLGLTANVSLYPEVDLSALKDLHKAGLQIFCERASDLGDTVHEMLGEGRRTVLTVPAAYGVAGTRACLSAIAAAAGKSAEFEKAWAKRLDAFLPRWEERRREAATRRLAFVVSEATLPGLSGLRFGQGAPVLRMAAEMGFGIDLLYFAADGKAPAPEALPPGARVRPFLTPAELARALREGEFHAVYSDVYFDDRVSRAGKSRFSSRFFEMGLEGARRSLERVLAACRNPFFSRHASHLPGGRDV